MSEGSAYGPAQEQDHHAADPRRYQTRAEAQKALDQANKNLVGVQLKLCAVEARRREMNRRMDIRKDNMVRMFQQMQIQMWTLYRHWVDTIRDEDRDMRDDLDFRYKVLSAEMDEAWDTVTAACQNIADLDQLD